MSSKYSNDKVFQGRDLKAFAELERAGWSEREGEDRASIVNCIDCETGRVKAPYVLDALNFYVEHFGHYKILEWDYPIRSQIIEALRQLPNAKLSELVKSIPATMTDGHV